MLTAGLPQAGEDIAALFRQRRDDFKAMAAAVQSGNIGQAQSALAAYQKDNDTIKSSTASSQHHGGPGRNPKLATDLSALTSAIQSGSIADAQEALKNYQADRDGPVGQDGTSEQDTTTAAPPSAPTTPQSSFLRDIIALFKDIFSGNSSAAQNDEAAIAQDVKNLFQGASADSSGAQGSADTTQSAVATGITLAVTSSGDPDGDGDAATAGTGADKDGAPVTSFTVALIEYERTAEEKSLQPSSA
jgi:hypothetical protein